MPGDYIPGEDAEFNTWQENYLTCATGHAAALGLVAADLAPLTAAQAAWASAYAAHVAADAGAGNAPRSKAGSLATLETGLRALTQRLQSSTSVTDAQRAGLKIPGRSKARTAAGLPTTRAVATVDTSQRLAHTISFMDEETPTKKAKPAGVMGAEIWVIIGDTPPPDPSELSFLVLDTNTPYLAQYTGAHVGLSADRQARNPIHAPLGQHPRRQRPLERNHQRNHHRLMNSAPQLNLMSEVEQGSVGHWSVSSGESPALHILQMHSR